MPTVFDDLEVRSRLRTAFDDLEAGGRASPVPGPRPGPATVFDDMEIGPDLSPSIPGPGIDQGRTTPPEASHVPITGAIAPQAGAERPFSEQRMDEPPLYQYGRPSPGMTPVPEAPIRASEGTRVTYDKLRGRKELREFKDAGYKEQPLYTDLALEADIEAMRQQERVKYAREHPADPEYGSGASAKADALIGGVFGFPQAVDPERFGTAREAFPGVHAGGEVASFMLAAGPIGKMFSPVIKAAAPHTRPILLEALKGMLTLGTYQTARGVLEGEKTEDIEKRGMKGALTGAVAYPAFKIIKTAISGKVKGVTSDELRDTFRTMTMDKPLTVRQKEIYDAVSQDYGGWSKQIIKEGVPGKTRAQAVGELFKAPALLIGFGLPDENAHAPDESLDLDNFYGGIRAMAHLYKKLAERGC